MKEMQISQLEDKEEIVGKVIQSFDIVTKQKKQGLYLENIANTCLSEFGWPMQKTIASLKHAEDLGKIYITVSNNIKNPSITTFQDRQV